MAIWYVRPDTSHSGTRNGTSYANAWGGWSEIVWGGAGVVGGDTLYVCGTHTMTSTLSVGTHGASSDSARATISGEYAADPGIMIATSAGSFYMRQPRNYTNVVGITFRNYSNLCLLLDNSASHCDVRRCRFEMGTLADGATHALNIIGTTGLTFTDLVLDGNYFTGRIINGTNATGAISWNISAAAVNAITRLTITNNTFENLIVVRGAVRLQTSATAGAGTALTDIVIDGNTFTNVEGVCIDVGSGFTAYGTHNGIKVRRNVIRGVIQSTVDTAMGGAISLFGFGPSTTASFGANEIAYNTATNVEGPNGFCNLFYGSYLVHDNYAANLSTQTIDGNGVIFDHGCTSSYVYGNRFYKLTGKAGVSNSGVGIMVLDSTTCYAFGNVVNGAKVGVHLGSAGTGQSCEVTGNTFANCSLYGIDLLLGADEANCTVKNNAFTAASGSAVSVRNAGAAWSGEDYNGFFGFAAASGHTLGTHDVFSNPGLTSDQTLTLSSPLLAAGVHFGYGWRYRDADGKQRPNPPSIGAFDTATLRPRLTTDPAA